MSQFPAQGPVVEVKPQPNVYTILIIVAILALGVAIAVALRTLMSPMPEGYGMEFGQLFEPFQAPRP